MRRVILAPGEQFTNAQLKRPSAFNPQALAAATDIIERVREYADLVWLENLNLRGQFKGTIMAYIREKHPELVPLYEDIYNRRRTDYWQALEREMADYAAANGMPYRVNDLPYGRSEKGHPVVVNYFYHEKIRRSNR